MTDETPANVALVTGGAVRVGRAICLELAAAGCDLAIHYHSSKSEAESLATEIAKIGRRAVLLQADLSSADVARRVIGDTIDQLGRLDVLVNNAAMFEPDAPGGWDSALAARQITLNLLAPMQLCASAAAPLKASGRGCIVNIADGRTDRPMRGYISYTASKAGLLGLTRALARELAPEIRVNAVAPGVAVFPDGMTESVRERILSRVPMGRAGRPQDVAMAVRYLVCDAPYVTGEVLVVDGGQSLG